MVHAIAKHTGAARHVEGERPLALRSVAPIDVRIFNNRAGVGAGAWAAGVHSGVQAQQVERGLRYIADGVLTFSLLAHRPPHKKQPLLYSHCRKPHLLATAHRRAEHRKRDRGPGRGPAERLRMGEQVERCSNAFPARGCRCLGKQVLRASGSGEHTPSPRVQEFPQGPMRARQHAATITGTPVRSGRRRPIGSTIPTKKQCAAVTRTGPRTTIFTRWTSSANCVPSPRW